MSETRFNMYVHIDGEGADYPEHEAVAKALRLLFPDGVRITVGSGTSTQNEHYVTGSLTPDALEEMAAQRSQQLMGLAAPDPFARSAPTFLP